MSYKLYVCQFFTNRVLLLFFRIYSILIKLGIRENISYFPKTRNLILFKWRNLQKTHLQTIYFLHDIKITYNEKELQSKVKTCQGAIKLIVIAKISNKIHQGLGKNSMVVAASQVRCVIHMISLGKTVLNRHRESFGRCRRS